MFFLFLVPLLLWTTGCRNRTDLVESELRTKDSMYREALEEQHKAAFRAETLEREVAALRQGTLLPPEVAAPTYGLKRIVLGRGTSGLDLDGLPGDEVLQVVVEPRDGDDHTIKAPGALTIFALEISPQGIKVPLASWEIPPDKLGSTWKQGLFSTGYTMTLPWKNFPVFESVRVVARFVTADQRVFETDRDVKVRVAPGAGLKRCEPPQKGFTPLPTPLPASEGSPLLLPTGQFTPASTPHETQWQPASLSNTVTFGRPEPLDGPASPPPLPTLEELRK